MTKTAPILFFFVAVALKVPPEINVSTDPLSVALSLNSGFEVIIVSTSVVATPPTDAKAIIETTRQFPAGTAKSVHAADEAAFMFTSA